MKELPLSQNKYTLVDDEDFDRCNQYKWYANKKRERDTYYALRTINGKRDSSGKSITSIKLHHFIFGKPPAGFVTDHIDRNGLNNQKSNLRFVSHIENNRNKACCHLVNNDPPYVYWHKRFKLWQIVAKVNSKRTHFGYYHTKEEAITAFSKKLEIVMSIDGLSVVATKRKG